MKPTTRFCAALLAITALSGAAIAQDTTTATEAPAAAVAPPIVTPAPAPAPKPVVAKPTPPKKKGPPDSLKPGQYVWEARAAQSTDLRIVAVLDIQRIYVFDKGELVAFSTISSGKKGHGTPAGTFKILQKNEKHFSNLYNNAPMPYMQRLTWDGIALHAGHIPGYPASHGCIRLPMAFAKALFGITKMDQTVFVFADLNTPPPAEGENAPAAAGGEAGAVTPPPAPEAKPAETPAPAPTTPTP